jgi:hypothetical protein
MPPAIEDPSPAAGELDGPNPLLRRDLGVGRGLDHLKNEKPGPHSSESNQEEEKQPYQPPGR